MDRIVLDWIGLDARKQTEQRDEKKKFSANVINIEKWLVNWMHLNKKKEPKLKKTYDKVTKKNFTT